MVLNVPSSTVLYTLEEFARYSGLKMNREKLRAKWFGCPRPPEETSIPDYNLGWNSQNFKILGVSFTTDLKNIINTNLEEHINKTKVKV